MTSLAEAVNNSGIGDNIGLNVIESEELVEYVLSLHRLILGNEAHNESVICNPIRKKTALDDCRQQREGIIDTIQMTKSIDGGIKGKYIKRDVLSAHIPKEGDCYRVLFHFNEGG
ncbi:hypothetical protein AgCh_001012 [Apium graveolens]